MTDRPYDKCVLWTDENGEMQSFMYNVGTLIPPHLPAAAAAAMRQGQMNLSNVLAITEAAKHISRL